MKRLHIYSQPEKFWGRDIVQQVPPNISDPRNTGCHQYHWQQWRDDWLEPTARRAGRESAPSAAYVSTGESSGGSFSGWHWGSQESFKKSFWAIWIAASLYTVEVGRHMTDSYEAVLP